MKYSTPEALFRAHLDDLSATFDGDFEDVIGACMTMLVSVLMTMHEGDTAATLNSLEGLVEYYDKHKHEMKKPSRPH